MIPTLKIGLQGLAPGASPLEIATQGLLISIAPPEPEDDAEIGLMPIFWGAPSRSRQDCTIEVRGCRATLSATDQNTAAAMPSTEELDAEMDRAEAAQILAEIEAAEEAHRQEQYLLKWQQVVPRWREHQAHKAKRKAFLDATRNLAAQMRGGADPIEDLAAVVIGLVQHQRELEKQISALTPAKKPSPKKRK